MDETAAPKRRITELEIELEDAKNLGAARERLLVKNIEELNEVYLSLRDKVSEIRERDQRIREFDAILTRANRLSSLGELAASIAHEIKNPLISIQGFARRIGAVDDADKIEKYASYIEKEAERLSTVLARLLDFSWMSEPKKDALDVNEVVDDTVLFLEHHLTRFKNIQLSVEKAEGLPSVYADKIHVQQALFNLVMNAAQAMSDGGPLLIRTGRTNDDQVAIEVVDKGTGIKEDVIGKIFEPFFTTKPKGEGTGLGLPLCKRLIEANRGTIEVESTPGEGSTFRVLLPSGETAAPEGT
jgi:two-component system sensor histidine kinase AtoS